MVTRTISFTPAFKKQLEKLKHSGMHAKHIKMLKEDLIPGFVNGQYPPFSADWDNHALTSFWVGYCELKLGGDTCVIYRLLNKKTEVELVGIGSHAQLKLA
jgi:addiction module RelE/StbE family toxin